MPNVELGEPKQSNSGGALDARCLLRVLTAVKKGDFTVRMPIEHTGLTGKIYDALNDIIDLEERTANELQHVSTVVGKEGKISQRASVAGATGGWAAQVDSVNTLIGDLVQPTAEVSRVITAVASGDLSQKMSLEIEGRSLTGEFLRTARTVNTMVDQLGTFASEVTRVAREVGRDGKLGGQAIVEDVTGTWRNLTDNVNAMAGNLTNQVRNIAEVTTAVAKGDLTRKITVEAKGEIQQLKTTINDMVDRLGAFAGEVTRVAREVGTEGQLGGQAQVEGVSGTWRSLTDNMNQMAANLTDQVRGIAKVVTAVAKGDLKSKPMLQAKGEIGELTETINDMIDTLSTFADEVTRVVRDVGVEGQLGGQANVPGAVGIWRDLTDNVNEMIRARQETTRVNAEQDWLKTNIAKFTRLLQGQRDIQTVSQLVMSELAPLVALHAGLFYLNEPADKQLLLRLRATYGFKERKNLSNQYRAGEGLVGQVLVEKQRILLTQVPDDYIKIHSGLGEGTPENIAVLPVVFEGEVLAVLELASFNSFSQIHLTFLEQLAESLGIVLNTIAATARTEELLKQSQSMAAELQTQQEELRETNKRLEEQAQTLQQSEQLLKEQQEELQQTNEELEEKAELLGKQNAEVERKNREVALASRALKEKAEQLTLTSKYKSEFLANMSHELRTPLNSMLILSKMLADNPEGNLTEKQAQYANTVHAAGSDLLGLITDILDLSKIESGTVRLDLGEVAFAGVRDYLMQTLQPVAQGKGLDFSIDLDRKLPTTIYTDGKRLQQVLKNLLSNACKFTEQGKVALDISVATGGWSPDHEMLGRAGTVVAFAVSDTGMGIPLDRQKIIFEAFQQADSTSSRKYGGVGLGLAISREIASMLGGEIRVVSSPGAGSTFTLYLPQHYVPHAARRGKRNPEDGSPSGGVLQDTGGPGATAELELDVVPRSVPAPAVLTHNELKDDRDDIKPNDRTVLIVEDDVSFAGVLLDMARERKFKCLVATSGEVGLALARKFRPDAITLDIRLPEMDGWTLLDVLKHDPNTRHIPVHVISVEDQRQRALRLGAITYVQKPVDRETLDATFARIRGFVERQAKNLLVVEDDETERNGIAELIGNGDVNTTLVGTGEEALAALRSKPFECVVLDLGLPDMSGFELIEKIKQEPGLAEVPIVVYTGRDLTPQEETELERIAETVIVKGVKSPDRLLAETALFLHRVEANVPEPKRRLIRHVCDADPVLEGKTVLIVDDDIRNIFALTSHLERYNTHVIHAENGRDAIELLKRTPGVDIVLMDIMMPGMDGYETIRAIRCMDQFKSLPIIAVTAKAMKGDRENCIAAGACDYIPKPVDVEQLRSLMRVWLYR